MTGTEGSGSSFINKSGRVWQITTFVLLIVSIGLLIALIVVASEKDKTKTRYVRVTSDSLEVSVCGSGGSNSNGNEIDLSEPDNPGPFHDLTKEELRKLRTFLQNDPDIQAVPISPTSGIPSSYIYMADLWVPPKADVLKFLNKRGPQPERKARVMMFRGDKNPPVVEEWICGPLPNVARCDLLQLPNNRRNPVEFSSRPFSTVEFLTIQFTLLAQVDNEIGYILRESYNATFSECENPMDCLTFNPVPTASGLTGQLDQRLTWMWATYQVPYSLLHPTDFGVQIDVSGSNFAEWSVRKVWYAGQSYDSLEDLKQGYDADSIPKSVLKKPVYSNELYSSLEKRGDPSPPNPQRPPTQVEPDGKRYSLKNRQVDYLGWQFNFRLSPFWGPTLFDIRFQGERIAYELGISEIAAFYSGNSPLSQATDYVDSGALSGMGTKALVPGGDCPDSATLVNYTVMNQHGVDPGVYDSVFCLFEHNNGYPLRRHLTYNRPIGFYGGMLDSVLTLRSAHTVGNYDYIIDFIFHQNGALETRLMSTGYIQSNIFRDVERLYGFKIQETILGNLHHHMFHLKADLDVGGTSNRYETLDIKPMNTSLTWNTSLPYVQTQFSSTLKRTELDALYQFNFEHPKDHIVFSKRNKNEYNLKKAYRIHMSGMSKNLLLEGMYNENAISWARNQIAVTKHKDEEFRSSSNYAMYDTLDPVVDFSTFYADDEDIVDEDLVFWMTLGLHHIPHTEDLPVTPTAGNHLTAYLLPYNYFPECPSMGSRDAIFVSYKDPLDPTKGVKLERNGNSEGQCVTPKVTLGEDLEENPDQVLETTRPAPTL